MLADFRHWLSRNGGVTSTMHHAPCTIHPMPDARPAAAAAPGDAFATKCPKSCEFFANAQFVCVNTFVRTAEQTKG